MNASFAFDGTAALLLNDFDNGTGTNAIDIQFDSGTNEYVFNLDGGVWNGVAAPGLTAAAGELRVSRGLFLDAGDTFSLQIDDNNNIGLNATFSGLDAIEFANSENNGSILLDVAGTVGINASIETFGNSFTIVAGSDITSTSTVNTQDLVNSGVASGAVSFTSTAGDINLAGGLNSSGADHTGAGATASQAGNIVLVTLDGAITVANIDASGGDATGGGGSVGGSGGSISITANDALADETHSIIVGGDLTTAGGTGDTQGAGAGITINADHNLTINAALTSGGSSIDLDASGAITSNASGSITSTSGEVDGTSGLITLNAGGQIDLAASVSSVGNTTNGDANNILVETVNGSISVVALNASGTGTGNGGNIVLDANGLNADISLAGAVLTNGAGAVTLNADDAVVFSATGSINAAGTGDVVVTANAVTTNGDSGDGITMNAGSFINAGTGTLASGLILLQSTGTNGGPIVAQQLTTRSNSIQLNSGDSLSLQQSLNSGGGAVDLDAITSLTSAATGSITTTAAVDSGMTSGSLTINAGTNIDLNGNIVTAGADHAVAGATASNAGQVTIATFDGFIELAGVDASGGNATGGAGSTGGNGTFLLVTVGDAVAGDTHNLTLTGVVTTAAGTGTTNGSAADIQLISDNDLSINAPLTARNLLLDATGNVTQSAAVTAAGLALQVGGTTTLTHAGNSIETLAADTGNAIAVVSGADLSIGTVAVNGIVTDDLVASTGDVSITAVSISDADAIPDGSDPDIAGDNVTLNATAGSIGVAGDIFLGTVNLLEVQAAGNLNATATAAIAINADVAGTVTFNSPSLVLISGGTLNIDDIFVTNDLRIEAADVVANDSTLDLTAARMLFISGAGETLNTTVGILDVRTGGDLVVNSTTAVELLDLNGDNVALATTTNDGSITITAPGTITVSDDVIAGLDGVTTSTGNVSMTASGATSDLVINDVVLTDVGNIQLSADHDVRIGDAATLSANDNLIAPNNDDLFLVTTTNGNITIAADADVSGDGELFMGNSGRIIAGRNTAADYVPNTGGLASTSVITLGASLGSGLAEVNLSAAGNVTLGSVQTANSTLDAMRITSRDAGIIDGGDAGDELVANYSGALVTLRTATGIGSADSIESAVHAIDVLNSGVGAVAIAEAAAGGDLNLVNASNAGLIRVTVADGSLFIVDSSFTPSNGDFEVTSTSGNIALQASEDIEVNSAVSSNSGHISLIAGDDLFINESITTAAAGSIYLRANNVNASDAPANRVDSINVRAALQTDAGDILVRSQADIHVFDNITATSGDIGLDAGNDILQDANLIASAGDVLLIAGGDYTMDSSASVQATSGDIVADVAGTIGLSSMSAINVGLDAGGNIADVNGGGAINVTATNLSMRAGGSIGSNDLISPTGVNNNAIDIAVDVLEAVATTGIYVQDNNDLTLGTVANITVQVLATRDDGTGGTTNESATGTITVAAGASTAAGNGPVKVFVAGELTIAAAVNSGVGDILLQAAFDIIVSANVASLSGNITLDAGDDIDVNAAVSTAGTGDLVLLAGNVNALDALPAHVDGITVGGTLASAAGELLISSAAELQLDAATNSTTGNIGLIAPGNIALNSGLISTSGSVLVSSSAAVSMAGASTISTGGDVVILSDSDLLLTIVSGNQVALQSLTGSILDANGTIVNVTATALSMRAAGSIGQADLGSPANVNNNAIDTQAGTLAAVAADGIYVLEANGVTVDGVGAVSVNLAGVTRAHFNSSTSTLSDATDGLALLSDLTTSIGPIKLVSTTGNIVINDGADADSLGVEIAGSADILLEAQAGSLLTTTGIIAGGGHVTLLASVDANLGDDVTTSDSGDIMVVATSGSITLDDGPDADGLGISVDAGSLLLQAGTNILLNSSVSSSSGQIGLDAGSNIVQNANLSTTNNILVLAGNDLTMASGTSTTATSNDLVIGVGGSASLGLLTATHVSIEAGGDILNTNGSTGNVLASNLRMIADSDSNGTGSIGAPDLLSAQPTINNNAIHIDVAVVAAQSADGIYLLETNDITIGEVAAIAVSIDDVTRAFFNSSTDLVAPLAAAHAALSDLTTTDNGSIKLVSDLGSITATDGGDGDLLSISAGGSGDILLSTFSFSDITLDAAVASGSGNISLLSPAALNINAPISTTTGDILLSAFDLTIDVNIVTGGGNLALLASQDIVQNVDITTAGGDVLITAGRDYTMLATAGPASTTVSTAGGDALIRVGRDFRLATIDAGAAGDVAIRVFGDILDINIDGRLNIIADTLSITAAGTIGTSDLINAPSANDNAINTQITTLSANAATGGIYIQEVDNLVLDAVAAVTINVAQVNFNSTTGSTGDLASGLEDVIAGGPIKIVTIDGSIEVNDGSDDDEVAISALGDILLLAGGATQSIVSTSGIESQSGHITLLASQDILVGEDVTTGGSGTIYIESTSASVSIADGSDSDLLGLQSDQGDILVRAATDVLIAGSVQSTNGNIGLIAAEDITINADVAGAQILMEAGQEFAMAATPVPDIVSIASLIDGEIIIRAGGDLRLALVDAGTGSVLLDAGGDIIDVNQDQRLNVVARQSAMIAGGMIGGPATLVLGPTQNDNAIDTSVDVLAAVSGTGTYIQEANAVRITDVTAFNIQVDVSVVHFNSTTSPLSESSSHLLQSDLVTTINGPIKLVTLAGDIIADDGSLGAGVSVSANGTGNVLLSAARDLIVNAAISSGTGHVTLEAGDDVDINAAVSTSGAGDLLVLAGNGNAAEATAGNVDGVTVGGALNVAAGQLLVSSAGNIQVDALVESATGSVAILGTNPVGGDILLNQLVRAIAGEILVSSAGGNVTMAGLGEVLAGSDVVIVALGTLGLTRVSGIHVGLQATSGSILDNNAGALNVTATRLSMRAAAGQIGAPGLPADAADNNTNAIDTQVADLAAQALNGIYVLEGDGVTITDVAAITAELTASRVNFDSTTSNFNSTRTLDSLSDLTTDVGAIKLVSTTGDITVTDGADADGGVVATGAANLLLDARLGDVDLLASATTAGGDITLRAGDDIHLASDVQVTSNSGGGDIYVFAGNVLAGGGITMDANSSITSNNQNIRLAVDNEGDIVVRAVNAGSGAISMAAEGSITQPADLITASTLRLWADANLNADGSQSVAAGNGVGSLGTAVNPLSIAVNTLAAKAAGSIFVSEADGLLIAPTGDINLRVVQFAPATPAIATDASLTDVESTQNGNQIQITATEIDLQSQLEAEAGLIQLTASNGSILQVVNPDPLVSNVITGRLELAATTSIHLSQTAVAELSATITAAVNSNHSNAAVNLAANAAGTRVLNNLLNGGELLDPDGLSLGDLANQFEFNSQFSQGYALFVRNSGDLTIVAAPASLDPAILVNGSANPNMYLETRGGDLNIADGTSAVDVSLATTNNINPGLVLIAGDQLNATGTIQTSATFAHVVNHANLNAQVFDGGSPPPPLGPPFSTQFVLAAAEALSSTEDTHVLQQVVMQFGSSNEVGFLGLIRYADARVQLFDNGNELLVADPDGPIGFRNGLDTAAFQRAIAFEDGFLSQNFQLPTEVVARRALNLFMFSNADNPNNIVDRAALRTTLENVFASGVTGGFALPGVMPPNFLPPVIALPELIVLEPPVQPIAPEVELPAPTPEEIEVAIYQIDFSDANRNGQVDAAELPDYDEATQLDEESVANRQVIKPKAGATPTQEDIQREKNKLLNNPNQPSGAYAIIKRDPEGNLTVLDVFGIRDWPEERTDGANQTEQVIDAQLPKLPPFKPSEPSGGSSERPEPLVPQPLEIVPPPGAAQPGTSDSASNSASGPRSMTASSLLLGTLWIARQRQQMTADVQGDAPPGEQAATAGRAQTEIDFSRRARLRRRLHASQDR